MQKFLDDLSPASRGANAILLQPYAEIFGIDWIEQKLPTFSRDIDFLMQSAESTDDADVVISTMVALHLGIADEDDPDCVGPDQPGPERFTQRLKYVHAAAGVTYMPKPLDDFLQERVDRVFRNNWAPADVEARPALERDLAFLAEAARSEAEALYALAVVSMLHLGVQLKERGTHGGNDELLRRIDYMADRVRMVFDRFETVRRHWREVLN